MVEDEDMKEEEKLEFDSTGQAIAYISQDQARVLEIDVTMPLTVTKIGAVGIVFRWPFMFALTILLLTGCGGPSPGPDSEQVGSPAKVSLIGVSETAFNALESTVQFKVNGAIFDTNPDAVRVLLNNELVSTNNIELSEDTISLISVLKEGRSHLILSAGDTQGLPVVIEITLWAGTDTLTVEVVDEIGRPVTDAVVTARLNDDQRVFARETSSGGQVSFVNLPHRTIILDVRASGNRFASAAVITEARTVRLTLRNFDEPSPIDNNNFSLGTDGWEIDADGDESTPVEIVQHGMGAALIGMHTNTGLLAHWLGIRFSASSIPTQQNTDMDLLLTTSGEGPQSISRTFTIKPGTKSVTVRYRFITSEVPGGFFGSEFNDFFNVSIRSKNGGGSASESNSMNGLGLGAFDATGATAWREIDLRVDEPGDTIQVDITVANVGDSQFDSRVIVDLVEEKKLAITGLVLNDIDNSSLQYLSVAQHSYFNGNTRIHGTVSIEGAQNDQLTTLELEILEGGAVVATANLAQGVRGTLLTAFGQDERVEITTSQLLFELVSAQAAGVDGTKNGRVTLRAKAKSKDGEEATREFGSVEKLVRYTQNNRYGGRDGGVGGDDWVKPTVKMIAGQFSGVTWGDFSNMNGGAFPPHKTHRTGNGIDGWFNGYNARDAQTAATIISFLNDPGIGPRVQFVYVTYQQRNTNPFWAAIKGVTLNDGRRARDVIRPFGGHQSHFHVRITDN